MEKRAVLHPLLAVVLSAALNVIIFPKLQLSWLAFVSLIPLLVLIPQYRSRRLFLYFALTGFLFNAGDLYWIVHVIKHYTNLNLVLSIGVVLLLCLVLSLFWGIFGALTGWYASRAGFIKAMLVAPFLWIVLEWARNHLTQFPWCILGDSQYNHLAIAQLATFFGVYGLSCLIVMVNCAFTTYIVVNKYHYLITTITIVVCITLYGEYRIRVPIEGEVLKVGCIQGNIPQDVKINYEFADQINKKQLQMTSHLIESHKPDIVFWSESSTIFPLQTGGEWTQQITDLARKTNTPLIIGSDSFAAEKIYNTAFLVNRKGEIESQYAKMYLVPFGEFVPFRSIFFFAGKVVPEISDFSGGEHYNLFSLGKNRFAIHICFEVVFPQLSREFTRRGAGLLTTITNDAWFSNSSAPYQHFAMAVMRAIENRRYLVRAANTGISGIVDPYGRILQQTHIYVPAEIVGEVRWLHDQTFYTRYGDVLIYAAILICLTAALLNANKSNNHPPHS